LKLEGISVNEANLYNKASDYFSVPNMFDTYSLSGMGNVTLGYIQDFLLHETRSYAMEVRALIQEQNTQTIFNFDLSLSDKSFNFVNCESLAFKEIADIMAQSINEVTSVKNDNGLMIDVFPDFDIDIASFDMVLENEEITLYQTLSTPDFKLYYPEPFIASPSFVHEDLWFIHILHYQH
jgi:hypothetical protein